ncbi:DEAD/DEAH box helicase [Curtobacterium sp. MCBA15_007]|uniref:DEAD/DEAH box helicase n=1 Tax=Curtobacterium sp. MCBA15_007 TaxID=1898735 RepID=UPI0008DD03CA|nr:DEAD/DEAH box helicase [Curtobacterium sp. MCBA15_007]OII06192.1 DEAD/DEAH box helicase [Curtobacterium sp. MCBA15_007]
MTDVTAPPPLVAAIPAAVDGVVDPDEVYEAFAAWAAEGGRPLYPAQDEAVIELVSGANVVLSTPTGTGKSLVAAGAHFAALAEGKRSYYTAPIKALVSEKFFQLVELFGAQNVGMVTGDSSVNADAPIVCCTAEILANLALRQGPDADVDVVVMDEFHFYGDPDRGWAWQVPLLVLERAQFLLMSATLGDVTTIADDLSRRTGRPTARVTGVSRPVPLEYQYVMTPVQETVERLLEEGKAPIYIVHFAQAAALERAQSLMSAKVASRERRDQIADAIAGFRFSAGFGQTLSRLIRAGIGVHHAGMLPKYRRLVEQLAQRGLLPVICGTDTLGVGINVPIRSVLFTGLTKFDGTKMRQLSAREFHQIAGRAGRAGYDTEGDVVAEAPEHDIENARAVAKAGDDPKKKNKIKRKKAPEGFVSWGQASFERLIAAEPEPMASRMRITHAMVLSVVARGGDAFADVRSLVYDNHEPRSRQLAMARRALVIARTLINARVIEKVDGAYRLTVDIAPNFALNQPLSPFALAAFELLDPSSPTYALDMVSVVEATLDDPRAILSQQQFKERGEAVARMKQEGIEYEERMELLEEVTWPKPLDELLTAAYEAYAAEQPWVLDFQLSPKAVVRDMYERAMTFGDFVRFYQLTRSEGLVLRYLSDAYRTMRQTIAEEQRTQELDDLIEWLGEVVRQTDSSLVDEWEALLNGDVLLASEEHEEIAPPQPARLTGNPRAFRVLVRNALFQRVLLAAADDIDGLGELDATVGFDRSAWDTVLEEYYEEHDSIGTDADARSMQYLVLDESGATASPRVWKARQIFSDPEGDKDFGFSATIDLDASDEVGEAVVRVTEIGRFDGWAEVDVD